MLKSHLNAVEAHLLQISQIPANSGHNLHKGTPREAFIKEFLVSHLSERVAIGTGEIIDANSTPNQQRNQIDIVIYKRDYPKIDFGGGINGFLAESVVATIEVKSVLTKRDLEVAIKTAQSIKLLQRNIITSFTSGYQPPSILNYVVAYDGATNMQTVLGWIQEVHRSNGINYPSMGAMLNERINVTSPSLDGIFVLGKGFVQFDNTPLGFLPDEARASNPRIRWTGANTTNNNLLLLFITLTQAISGVSGSWLNPIPYLSSVSLSGQSLMFLTE
jgi:hypothetical protein